MLKSFQEEENKRFDEEFPVLMTGRKGWQVTPQVKSFLKEHDKRLLKKIREEVEEKIASLEFTMNQTAVTDKRNYKVAQNTLKEFLSKLQEE